MKYWLSIAFYTLFTSFYAQVRGDVELESFFAIVTKSSVELNWTLSSGFVCNGTKILRSEDGVNFQKTGEIEGICGSSSEDTPYSFTDKNPIKNALNYYKLELGLVGESQIIKAFYVDLSSQASLVLPNPSRDSVTIYFRNDFKISVDFSIFSSDGNHIFTEKNLYDSKVNLNVSTYPDGIYYFIITSKNSTIKGKLVVVH